VAAPRISVVIPVFDGERFLGEAIESVLAQTLAPAEVIVVDDGSSDASAAVGESFGPPARVIRARHRGVSEARNTGVTESAGELIAFLDADDLMKPDRLERQAAVLGEPPGADFVLGRAEVLLEEGVEPPEFITAKLAPVAEGRDQYWAMTLLTRRDAFDRVGPFDPEMRLGQDSDWLMRAFEAGLSHALVEEPVILRRFHGANATYDTSGSQRATFEILRRRAARHRGRGGARQG
jgi:glycosyltransferase involved in cell wall biosynthesis